MSEVVFSHSKVGQLVVETGFNEVSWSYDLNIAVFQTYGGEVVQILSCFIDDMTIEGEVKKYKKAEEIYEFFARYFTIATQGQSSTAPSGALRFEQEPVIMQYHARNWEFAIQPTDAPDFIYGNEVVVPRWGIKAHIVDRGLQNDQLKAFVAEFAQGEIAKLGGRFNLVGELSPVSGNPANNPFIAPLVEGASDKKQNGAVTFEPIKAEEIMADVHRFSDYYTSLIPSYLQGDFVDAAQVAGSGPIFGKPAEPSTTEAGKKEKVAEKLTNAKTNG